MYKDGNLLKIDYGRRSVAEQLKLPEVARRLGVSEKTARRYIRSGTLPSMFIGGAYRVEEADLEAFLQGARVSPPGKAPRRSSPEPLNSDGIEAERRLRYLRAWRAFVYRIAGRWKEETPTTREIATLFDTMTALVEQGVFASDTTDPSEQGELILIMHGFEELNAIADSVEKDEEAKQRRDTFRLIQEKRGA
jgi:excisionase family DNA binding protein